MEPTRRDILGGLFVSIAAPYVVRTSGLLMPIRHRGPGIPLAEVLALRRDLAELEARRIMINPTAAGFNRTMRMADAEKRYQRMGLL
jgi:hypothetical protein